jgi:hypothetical protein
LTREFMRGRFESLVSTTARDKLKRARVGCR